MRASDLKLPGEGAPGSVQTLSSPHPPQPPIGSPGISLGTLPVPAPVHRPLPPQECGLLGASTMCLGGLSAPGVSQCQIRGHPRNPSQCQIRGHVGAGLPSTSHSLCLPESPWNRCCCCPMSQGNSTKHLAAPRCSTELTGGRCCPGPGAMHLSCWSHRAPTA